MPFAKQSHGPRSLLNILSLRLVDHAHPDTTTRISCMACDRIVALNVIDEDAYQEYRNGTADLLAEYGGQRLYDFRVSETLASEVDHPINRVFLIRFPDRAAMTGYFADPTYKSARAEHFEDAVAGATLIGAYVDD